MPEFVWEPQYVWESTLGHKVLVSEFESGREQRRYKGRRPKQWKLTFRDRPEIIGAIQDFFDARKGSLEPFDWIPPGSNTPVSVRFEADTLSISSQGRVCAECELVLMEVL